MTQPQERAATAERERDIERDAHGPIDVIDFEPTDPHAVRRRAPRRLWPAALMLVVALLGMALWFVFTARAVWVTVTPAPDTVAIDAGVFKIRWKDHFLVRPGELHVQADKAGYYPLRETVAVGKDQNQTFQFELEKLPGLLTLGLPDGLESVEVLVDEQPWPVAPTDAAELKPGVHRIMVNAQRYQRFETEVEIEGGGSEQTLAIDLVPDWAEITVSSTPPGARVMIDGEAIGETPGVVEVLAGEHTIGLHTKGYKRWERPLRVVANVHQTLPEARLEKADGLLTVRTGPAGAALRVNGRFRGQTPMTLRLPPGRNYTLAVSKAGFEAASREVRVESDEDIDVEFALDPMIGQVRFRIEPANATLRVNSEIIADPGAILDLSAIEHEIEVALEGYVTVRQSVTPRPNFTQDVAVKLMTVEAARLASLKKEIESGAGHILLLMRPRPFTMGASRRERGRRANETLRDANLTAEYYLATTEVTNKEFREFDSEHDSGSVFKVKLTAKDHAVVNVTWDQAARYCNWLSERDGLPLAYEEIDGRMQARTGHNTGYRLPTEAEWAWAARYAGRSGPPRFPWGQDLPPPNDAGNYADRSAIGLVSATLKKYNDSFAATAPVGSFAADANGLYDIGGNVSEWINDVYSTGVAGAPRDAESRVIRGSSWMHSDLSELRLTYRDYSDDKRPDVGFRIARSAE